MVGAYICTYTEAGRTYKETVVYTTIQRQTHAGVFTCTQIHAEACVCARARTLVAARSFAAYTFRGNT